MALTKTAALERLRGLAQTRRRLRGSIERTAKRAQAAGATYEEIGAALSISTMQAHRLVNGRRDRPGKAD